MNTPNTEQDDNSYELSIKYNKAYNKWKDLSQREKEKNEWKKILQVLERINKQY